MSAGLTITVARITQGVETGKVKRRYHLVLEY